MQHEDGLLGSGFRVSQCRGAGGVEELHVTLVPERAASFAEQLGEIEERYDAVLAMLGWGRDTAVFRRCFLSDAANQEAAVRASRIGLASSASSPEEHVALSLVEQPPLPEEHVALWAWHVRAPGMSKRALPGGLRVELGSETRVWLSDTLAFDPEGGVGARAQTRSAFAALSARLAEQGAILADHVMRTWIFVEDVDLNYGDMVVERRELFAEAGLGPSTHYIASTGIAGRRADAQRLVQLEAYAIPGIGAERVRFLEAPEHLGRTDDYGVTFERGVQVQLASGVQTFISGTASIDPAGNVLHVGDVRKQLDRALDNVAALLEAGQQSLDDLVQMIVYLRDAADRPLIEPLLEERFPQLPFVLVHAPVCRPEWLIEIECIAQS
jgi:enamine deaminase RidA (YjgF/YER057c/UK114 family)